MSEPVAGQDSQDHLPGKDGGQKLQSWLDLFPGLLQQLELAEVASDVFLLVHHALCRQILHLLSFTGLAVTNIRSAPEC